MSYPAPAFPVKHPQPQAPGLEVRCVRAADPAAEVLITEMGYQYLARYGPGDDLNSYRPGDFEPPAGAFLLLLDGQLTVTRAAKTRILDVGAGTG